MTYSNVTDIHPTIRRLRRNADLLCEWAQETYDDPIGYTREGVQWLGDHIEAMRTAGDPAPTPRELSLYGAFLGECLCQLYGARWVQRGNTWVVDARRGHTHLEVHVFEKVEKQWRYGTLDHVTGLLEVLDHYLAAALPLVDTCYLPATA